ncbi:MAG: NADH:flavin oxidoreductase/NADH oxidase [Rhodospirillales bacterium]|jgi:2,4-dienoyl-CoA reductase-like NADH-dependent reductase (Old Yellow Enzyme family)
MSLLSPIRLGGIDLPNRVQVAPMCQYSSTDGMPSGWHWGHLGTMAVSQAGLVVLEASGVVPEGRITPACLGIWSDVHADALKAILDQVRPQGDVRFGIQLAHAGRKASAQPPWEGGGPLKPDQSPWPTVAPSALPHADGWHVPRALEAGEIAGLARDFAAAAARSAAAGFDAIELHAAHGYLLHQFQSPISNRRDDAWGGTAVKRRRAPLEVAEAVRAAWPKDRILGARITGHDWVDGGLTEEDAIAFAAELKAIGYDYLCLTSGGIHPGQKVPTSPGYQVHLARAVKRNVDITVRAVGMIVDPRHADAVVLDGDADLVAIGRPYLDDPRWVWHAADALGVEIAVPRPFERGRPKLWPGAALRRG